ncbi:MAG: sugar transferase [Paludibacter sp.]|jgi:exopolysaccharide biosynthesis polyprenyl glycosylphosphotransferase|nr:sugar transferase [Paludibacter sp.]
MITKRENHLSSIMITVQVALSLLLFYATNLIIPHYNTNTLDILFYMSQICIIWVFLLVKLRLGTIFRMKSILNMIKGYLVMIIIGGTLLILETFVCRMLGYTAFAYKNTLLFIALDFALLVVFKLAFYYAVTILNRIGKTYINVVIIADALSSQFIREFIKNNDWGYKLIAIISPTDELSEQFENVKVMANNEEIIDFVIHNQISEVLYCIPLTDKFYQIENLISEIEEIGVSSYLVQESFLKNIHNNPTYKKNIRQISGTQHYISLKLKALLELTFSSMVLVIFSPLFALIAFLILLDDGGPIFFRQQRIGVNGRRFMCYKFRTMVVNAEQMLEKLKDLNEVSGPVFKIKNDPRITKIGKFLRKTSLDELPQFYNVIKGEMAVVGPRPPLLSEVQQYKRPQLRRLSMKPGITCIWQVEGRNKVSFDEWIEMDLQYIDNWSLWLDLKLVLKTVIIIFKGTGS